MLNKIVNKLNVVVLAAGFFVSIVVDAAPILWSADSSGRLGTVDVATGNVNVIGDMGVTMTDIAFDPDGDLWGITFTSLYKIDKTTAASTLIGNLGTSALSLVFNSSGILYTANSSLYTIDTTTGTASLVGNGGDSYLSSGDLAFVGGELFLSSSGGDNLVKINTGDGSGSLIGDIGFSSVFGLASPNGTDLFGLEGTNIISIDSATGMGTFILDYSGNGLGQSFGSAFVTEAMVPVPPVGTECTLDADGNASVDALTDGLLFIRYLFGIRDESLIVGAVASNCVNCSAVVLESILEQCGTAGTSDIDGNGEVDALTDGLLIIRYLIGIRGDALIAGSVANNCSRCAASEIETYLQGLIPLPPTPTPIKILPLGDSITDSIDGNPSYRRSLWKQLNSAEHNVDFVGRPGYRHTTVTEDLLDYDLDHEGHSGWEANQIEDNISSWLNEFTADIVLLHVGTNDLDRGGRGEAVNDTINETLAEIDGIISKLRAHNSSTVILLAKIIPMRNYDTAVFNSKIDAFVSARTTTASPIVVVDQYTGFDANADTYDNYHPNAAGESKMADKWFKALQPFL